MKVSKDEVKRFYETHGGKDCWWGFPQLDFKPGVILRFKEKHGTRLFDCSTLELAGKACLKILAERNGEYSYYDEDEQPEEPAITKLQAASLPASKAKIAAFEEWDDYEEAKKHYERSKRFHAAVLEALKTKDYMLAIALIFARRYEYEEVSEEYLEEV